VAMTAVSSAKVAVMESGEVGRSAMYRRYSKRPRTLPWVTPALTGVRSVSSVSTFTMNYELCCQDIDSCSMGAYVDSRTQARTHNPFPYRIVGATTRNVC
jgi:hypothetical protein